MIRPEIFKTATPILKRMQSRFPILNGHVIGSQAGFSLIEIIVSLILVGILASMGGMAIVQVVQGYMITKENSTTTQQAQLAMSRITREIVEMVNIPTDATATVLPIRNVNGNRIIGLDNGAVKIALDPATLPNGDILINNVTALTLTYWSRNASTGAVVSSSTWLASNDITTLTSIDINMQVTPPGGAVLNFVNRVAPRNNKNQGGAAPSATPPSAVTYGTGCFVATAAYGDPGHPMVQILRDFRDRCLLTWSGGRWLVKQYYAHGPVAADLIHNRPLAMWAVRCLLAPVVALTFFWVYAPLAIPVLIVLSLIMTVALFSAARRGVLPLQSGVFRARGSVLIGLIATMVIMATLGAAMLPMFSASYLNQVYADQGRKTYYLAESGFRYAASQFLNASSVAAKDAAMTGMNNKTCTLLNSAGSFTTIVYPYWYKTQAAAALATTLATQVSGTIPTEFNGNFSAGQIRVNNSYYNYSSGSGAGTTITFNGLSPALPTTAAGLDVQPMTQTSSTGLTKSGILTLSGNGYGSFPLLNGNFILYPAPTGAGISSGAVFNYTNRIDNTLYNVTLANGNQNASWTVPATVTTGTNVVLDKFIKLSSTGTIGNASREVIYNIPVGWMAGGEGWGKPQDIEQMNNDNNFFTAQGLGTHTTSGGAMQVTSVNASGSPTGLAGWLAGLLGWQASGSGYWAFNAFNWGNTNANLAQAWMDAEGSLSYDLQVKVMNTGPYFMAGLGFRMANNSNNTDLYQYGVSFVRARQTRTRVCADPPDNWCLGWSGYSQNIDMASELIPAALYPSSPEEGSTYACGWPNGCQDRYSKPAIILWQRTGPATGTGAFKLLAYRILTEADGVLVTGSCPNCRLKPWSSLMVRLIEGYELPFTLGLVDASSRHLKYGDTIKNSDGTKTARVIGTPIITTNWGGAGSTAAVGTLVLTNVTGTGFTSGEYIYLEGGTGSAYAQASAAQAATKANYIMVYYSDDKTEVAGNTVEADNTRIGNVHDGANFVAGKVWPPDDRTDLAAGLPTATPAGNDYFSLVQWNYSTLVPGSALALSVPAPVEGWTYSASNLSRVVAHGTPITPPLTSGWTRDAWIYGSSDLRKTNNTTSTATYPVSTTAGTKYDVAMTIYRTSTNLANRTASYTFGGVSGGNITGTRNTSVNYGPMTFTAAGSTTIFAITGNNAWQGRLTALSVTPHVTAADQSVTHNTLTIGTTYNVAVNVSSSPVPVGSFYYTIGGCTSGICSATGACNLTCTASTTAPLTFVSPAADNLFTASISVTSADTVTSTSTLDTTADSQGNVASYVPALGTTDFYQAVIKTGALHSTAWTSSSTTSDFTGDAIALSTSGCTPSTSGCYYGDGSYTYYDDFGIQLDTKSGQGFLPPIQQ